MVYLSWKQKFTSGTKYEHTEFRPRSSAMHRSRIKDVLVKCRKACIRI